MRVIDCGAFLFDPTPLAMFVSQFCGIIFGFAWWPCGGCGEESVECGACVDGIGPPSVIVHLAWTGDPFQTCTGGGVCSDITGDYVLDHLHTHVNGNNYACSYWLPSAQGLCAAGNARAECGDGDGLITGQPCGSICATIRGSITGPSSSIDVVSYFGKRGGDVECDNQNFGNTPLGTLTPCLELDEEPLFGTGGPIVDCTFSLTCSVSSA